MAELYFTMLWLIAAFPDSYSSLTCNSYEQSYVRFVCPKLHLIRGNVCYSGDWGQYWTAKFTCNNGYILYGRHESYCMFGFGKGWHWIGGPPYCHLASITEEILDETVTKATSTLSTSSRLSRYPKPSTPVANSGTANDFITTVKTVLEPNVTITESLSSELPDIGHRLTKLPISKSTGNNMNFASDSLIGVFEEDQMRNTRSPIEDRPRHRRDYTITYITLSIACTFALIFFLAIAILCCRKSKQNYTRLLESFKTRGWIACQEKPGTFSTSSTKKPMVVLPDLNISTVPVERDTRIYPMRSDWFDPNVNQGSFWSCSNIADEAGTLTNEGFEDEDFMLEIFRRVSDHTPRQPVSEYAKVSDNGVISFDEDTTDSDSSPKSAEYTAAATKISTPTYEDEHIYSSVIPRSGRSSGFAPNVSESKEDDGGRDTYDHIVPGFVRVGADPPNDGHRNAYSIYNLPFDDATYSHLASYGHRRFSADEKYAHLHDYWLHPHPARGQTEHDYSHLPSNTRTDERSQHNPDSGNTDTNYDHLSPRQGGNPSKL